MNSSLSGRRVLVVEDEMLVAWNLEDLLADLGYVVVGPAAGIDQALTMIGAEAIDAALLDVNLDGRPSYRVADALVARGVPFAFSTGYEREGLAAGYQTVPSVRKPFRASEVADMLAKLLTPGGPEIDPPEGESLS
jgi:CheY-like chemotaxis protein